MNSSLYSETFFPFNLLTAINILWDIFSLDIIQNVDITSVGQLDNSFTVTASHFVLPMYKWWFKFKHDFLIFQMFLCNQWLSPLTLRVRILLKRSVLDTILCDKVCQWLVASQWFSLGTPVSSTNKTDLHNITEILLKVALNTINQTNHFIYF